VQSNAIYNTFQSVLHAYEINKVDLHEMIWLRWSSYIQTETPDPLQIIVQPSGHITTVYDTFAMQSSVSFVPESVTESDERSDHAFTASASQTYNIQSSFQASSFYIRTTPGRILFNNLIYENLFF
jgi:hypothetical protein